MKRGTRVRVIDPKRAEFLGQGVISLRCRECRKDGYEAWYVWFDNGGLVHFLADQLKEVPLCPR